MANQFEKDIDLDARLVCQAMKGGVHAVVNYAFLNRHIFDNPDMAVQRCNWLKTQDEDYINQVSKRAAELESM